MSFSVSRWQEFPVNTRIWSQNWVFISLHIYFDMDIKSNVEYFAQSFPFYFPPRFLDGHWHHDVLLSISSLLVAHHMWHHSAMCACVCVCVNDRIRRCCSQHFFSWSLAYQRDKQQISFSGSVTGTAVHRRYTVLSARAELITDLCRPPTQR